MLVGGEGSGILPNDDDEEEEEEEEFCSSISSGNSCWMKGWGEPLSTTSRSLFKASLLDSPKVPMVYATPPAVVRGGGGPEVCIMRG